MIQNLVQLEGALRQIAWAADALEGIRRDMREENALLFPVIAASYVSHIREMAEEAREYVRLTSGLTQTQEANDPWDAADREQTQPHREKVAA